MHTKLALAFRTTLVFFCFKVQGLIVWIVAQTYVHFDQVFTLFACETHTRHKRKNILFFRFVTLTVGYLHFCLARTIRLGCMWKICVFGSVTGHFVILTWCKRESEKNWYDNYGETNDNCNKQKKKSFTKPAKPNEKHIQTPFKITFHFQFGQYNFRWISTARFTLCIYSGN